MRALISTLAILAMCGPAIAGGVEETQVMTPPTTAAPSDSGWFGSGYLGYGSTSFLNTDDDDYGGRGTLTFGGVVGIDYNGFRAYVDYNSISRDRAPGEDFDDSYPEGAQSYGLHVGYGFQPTFGDVYVGGFYGYNRFQGDDGAGDNGFVDGELYGLEAEVIFDGTTVFGQYGMADMVGDAGDTAFDGHFYMVGIAQDFDMFSVIADYEAGRSDDIFEDDGDWGEYGVFTLTIEAPVRDLGTAYISASQSGFIANDEDEGGETRFEVGFRMNFGSAPSRRTNLTTSYNPGLAAAWAEALD